MTIEELTMYWNPAWRRVFNQEYATISKSEQLQKLLGITEYTDFFRLNGEPFEPMSEELKKLLVMLAGPHGKTILKAYRIRKGLE